MSLQRLASHVRLLGSSAARGDVLRRGVDHWCDLQGYLLRSGSADQPYQIGPAAFEHLTVALYGFFGEVGGVEQ